MLFLPFAPEDEILTDAFGACLGDFAG